MQLQLKTNSKQIIYEKSTIDYYVRFYYVFMFLL
jgi:hypothetical protein